MKHQGKREIGLTNLRLLMEDYFYDNMLKIRQRMNKQYDESIKR